MLKYFRDLTQTHNLYPNKQCSQDDATPCITPTPIPEHTLLDSPIGERQGLLVGGFGRIAQESLLLLPARRHRVLEIVQELAPV